MSRQQIATAFVLLILGLAASCPVYAMPEHVSYQGQLLSNGQAYDGNAEFKFAIVINGGADTAWSHDGTSTAGSEPLSSMTLPVDSGIFSVRLGELASGQIPLLADFLANASDAALRVWVDTGSGFEQLSDQPLSAAAFAQRSDAADRSLGDFIVPGNLAVGSTVTVGGIVEMAGFQLSNAPQPGYVLTSDGSGIGSWQPAGAGQADTDWTISGSNMYSGVAGNVGIGTATPVEKLHVMGNGFFQLAADRSISVTTPGGWPGLIAITPNSHRRDIIFDDSGMRLLAGSTGDPAPPANGITIRENGWVGVNTQSPATNFHVNGTSQATAYQVKNSGWTDVTLSSDGTLGGFLELRGPDGVSDFGISMNAAGISGGAIMDLYNGANSATVELNGSNGTVVLGDGTQARLFLEGSSGSRVRASNNSGTITYQMAAHAFGGGSQTNMYDADGQIAQQWTAENREWKVTNASNQLQILTRGDGTGGEMTLYQTDGHAGVVLDGDNGGDGEIRVYDQSGATSVRIVGHDSGGNGRVITDVLEITGGADLSENFDINGNGPVEPGMVVCIDPDDVGKLVSSRRPYQRTVAGIVSGAGGVRPGMLMGQQGSQADGEHPVALTGRVWTWCDASEGAIMAGDLLTSSATPGHAMKVTDHSRANGAILGKAMSKLESGRGLVLVLVSLQ